MTKKTQAPTAPVTRPPIVAVLGHVDHGKTTLLDYIRKTSVAAREHGGITQHIGAYQIVYGPKSKDQRIITFIDTPGHEAFAKIRSRGAAVADIGILVVAADDSVKPQTLESIRQLKASQTSIIVAINKMDVPGANVEKVKSDLAKAGIQVEGFGGDIPFVQISAKTGDGVQNLLDLILLVADMKELHIDPAAPAEAVVIESKLDKFRGMVATLIVKSGTFSTGKSLFEGDIPVGKVRAMFDFDNKKLDIASPSCPVELLGFTKLPTIGSQITELAGAGEAKHAQPVLAAMSALDFMANMDEEAKKKLKLIIKADTGGSLEAITEALPQKQIDIVKTAVGDINEADIFEARSTGSIVIGFNVKSGAAVEKIARFEKVIVRVYTIIYELIDEMEEVVEGMKELVVTERELGRGTIIAQFPFDHDRIAGTKITMGRLAKGDTVRVMRDEVEIARARIRSVHKGKEEATKIEVGGECGILFDKKVDFLLKDDIIAFTTG
jgi:translation initiation factor IF-2